MNHYIVDSSALIHGFKIQRDLGKFYTVPEVIEEVKSEDARLEVETRLSSGELVVLEPSKDSLERIMEEARRSGDLDKLSRTDLKLLALALEMIDLNPIILTDDYDIQNLAKRLGIPYRPLYKKGIREEIEWLWRCTGCGKIYREKLPECDVCGSELISVPRRKKALSGDDCDLA